MDAYIAGLRNSKARGASHLAPPHHDIYSIEDLAQLIHDLHQVHPAAKVSVKLVAEIGIGTIAAGVAKANADVIQISGHDGGTGASPLSSIKHAGVPWELGLAEVHRCLLDNGLRQRVILRTDGGLKTGWDVVIAALLGAEEFGFGSVAMIAEGCIMARVCHTNTCPVGVATQKEALRRRFVGLPEHVVNFFVYMAEEVRQLISRLGLRSMDDLIGRTDLLATRNVTLHKTRGVDMGSLLEPMPQAHDHNWRKHDAQAHDNGPVLLDELLTDPALQQAVDRHGSMTVDLEIANTDRSVGARLAGLIAAQHGNRGFGGQLRLRFRGCAGQSFGAFCVQGLDMVLHGEANDYVGKGMNGGRLVIVPPRASHPASGQSRDPGQHLPVRSHGGTTVCPWPGRRALRGAQQWRPGRCRGGRGPLLRVHDRWGDCGAGSHGTQRGRWHDGWGGLPAPTGTTPRPCASTGTPSNCAAWRSPRCWPVNSRPSWKPIWWPQAAPGREKFWRSGMSSNPVSSPWCPLPRKMCWGCLHLLSRLAQPSPMSVSGPDKLMFHTWPCLDSVCP